MPRERGEHQGDILRTGWGLSERMDTTSARSRWWLGLATLCLLGASALPAEVQQAVRGTSTGPEEQCQWQAPENGASWSDCELVRAVAKWGGYEQSVPRVRGLEEVAQSDPTRRMPGRVHGVT